MAADAGKSVADYRLLAERYDHATRRINGVRLAGRVPGVGVRRPEHRRLPGYGRVHR
jgi:hypothetical protein